MKSLSTLAMVAVAICFVSCNSNSKPDKKAIKAEIEKILQIQEDAYDQNNEEARQKMAATCEDSLIFIGGDTGGMANTANYYVHDLADGYTKRPNDKVFRIYDETVIVTSTHQSFKIFEKDTIYFNHRSTKVFVNGHDGWKMAYVTYAPLPVTYSKPDYRNASVFQDYIGVYRESSSVTDTVSVTDGRVFLSSGGSGKSELFPINDSTFFGKDYFGKTIFVRNEKGIVTHNCFEFVDGQRLVFPKIK